MTDFQIVMAYMEKTYPKRPYSIVRGNGCTWVTLGMTDIYFYVADERIVDVIFE